MKTQPNQTHPDLLYVAGGWLSNDDWGMPSIYDGTLDDINECLQAGDNAKALRKHGQHALADCVQAGCADRIPAYIGRHDRMQRQLQEASTEAARKTRAKELLAAVNVVADSEWPDPLTAKGGPR